MVTFAGIRIERPLIMGIVNATPDSFSDGGAYDPVEHGLKLAAEGADIIDVGGESTRPGAAPVAEEEELRRVLPVLRELTQTSRVPVPVSIDTMKPGVARAALETGVSMVNDIAANREDSELWEIVRESGAGYVLMHMQGTPETMQREPRYDDVLKEMGRFYDERLRRLAGCGVSREQIVLDPGLGFGKTVEHNLQLLAGLGHFKAYQRPMLVGASRKGFIGSITGAQNANERLPGSLACAIAAVEAGAQIIRTHDVAATKQALRMMEAIQARRK